MPASGPVVRRVAKHRQESITPCGDDLLSVRAIDASDAQRIAWRICEYGDWLEVVPGLDSVVVQFDAAHQDGAAATELLQRLLAKSDVQRAAVPEELNIPVDYGGAAGPDLAAVCGELQLSLQAFVELHTSRSFEVDMLGFTPGFAYVGGFDEAANVSRLSEPRQFVAAGSVGIAAGRTGIYGLAGPGGWPIIGRTVIPMFDPAAEDPFRLRAGMRVRFVAATMAGE